MRTVLVDGLRVAYERIGDGPPVVLLHGYVGDGPTTWHRQLQGLAGELSLIAWDAPGAGASSDPPEAFGMAGYADCLAGFIAELGLERPAVVGLSFGGALGIELARRHPTVAGCFVMVSAYAGWAGSLPADVARQRLRQALELSERTPDEFVDALLPTMFSEGTPREVIDAFAASMRTFHPIGFRAMARASAEDLRDALACVEVPTLLVYGDRDVRAPRHVAEHLHHAIAGSTLVVLPGAGHVCNVEAAADFDTALTAFVRERTS